ncbi:MAG TPA: glycosyltransferase family 2 protein [Luteibacter sp.]|jgi:glycosyltransferase involved in cell wall biosynthesis|uniref:glycosyltransferase family 2 protein n=1 Tax=Luteibacter sp. TaxID=1886636 RepID=UPI002F417DD5
MKLIIQIPCLNEEGTLGIALDELPRTVEGFDSVEWLIIDDGSSDRTVEVAKAHGVDHVVSHPCNQGLARAFMSGIEACLHLGADVIVNTDADNQYAATDIPVLTAPITTGKAEMVIGSRPIGTIDHFSKVKKFLQGMGSKVVRLASGSDVTDAPSGFRAISRCAAQQLVVFNRYTYTLETIIQAGQKGITLVSVPVHVNGELRPSRLVRSIPSYVRRSIVTIVRIFVVYRPFRFFASIGAVLFVAGMIPGIRFVTKYLQGDGDGHIQSLILAAILLGMGFQTMLIAFIADLLAANRRLLEDVRFKQAVAADQQQTHEDAGHGA